MLDELFEAFLGMKKGEKIENPTGLVLTDMVIPDFVFRIIGAKSKKISFTNLSLKHLAEKHEEGQRLLKLMPKIIENPDEVRQGKTSERFLISKSFADIKYCRPHAVNIEVTNKNGNIVITAFQVFPKYLQNFELLWRTASPPSQQPPKATGGSSGFSALKEARNSRNKLGK